MEVDEEDLEDRGGCGFVFQCGLSDNKPYFDGSYVATTSGIRTVDDTIIE